MPLDTESSAQNRSVEAQPSYEGAGSFGPERATVEQGSLPEFDGDAAIREAQQQIARVIETESIESLSEPERLEHLTAIAAALGNLRHGRLQEDNERRAA